MGRSTRRSITTSAPRLLVGRGLARLWGWLPSERLKTGLLKVWASTFLVSAVAVIFDDEEKVLLFRHSHDRRHPWGLPSGRVEAGERPEETIVRELYEEAGLQAVVLGLVALEREPNLPVLRAAYLCQLAGGLFGPSVEVIEARFYALDELPHCLRPLQQRIIERSTHVRRLLCASS